MPKRTKQSDALGGREKWQARAGADATNSELNFADVIRGLLADASLSHYILTEKPSDMKRIYGRRGIFPDFSIKNADTGRKVFIEVKRQGPGGNAHERACKYFAPGLIKEGRKAGNLSANDFPFFFIFANSLADDERYRPEITKWFNDELAAYFLLWKKREAKLLVDFFHNNIRPVLDGK